MILRQAGDAAGLWRRIRADIRRVARRFLPGSAAPPTVDDALALVRVRAFTKAMDLLRPLSEKGDAAAKRVIGMMYLEGYGVLPNTAEAAVWLREAAEAGDIEGQHQLALIYALGQKRMDERASSFGKWYTAMVLSGSALASVGAHDLFPDGMTVDRDYAEATVWARKAAEAGHTEAQNNLGILLLHGRGVACDPQEAAHWFAKAMDAGNTTAKAYLGIMAARGDTGAQDWDRAYALMGEAADAGNTLAQTTLGYWCVTGAGRAMDTARGLAHLVLAAAKGAPEAQYLVGGCAAEGRGMARNPSQAETWLRRASMKDYLPAILALGKLYSSGDLGVRNHTEAAPLLKRAAEHGIYEAQLIYGRHVLIGAGTAQSLTEAHMWFEKAFSQKDTPDVRYELGRVLIWMRPGQRASNEALEHLRNAAGRGINDASTLLTSLESAVLL